MTFMTCVVKFGLLTSVQRAVVTASCAAIAPEGLCASGSEDLAEHCVARMASVKDLLAITTVRGCIQLSLGVHSLQCRAARQATFCHHTSPS